MGDFSNPRSDNEARGDKSMSKPPPYIEVPMKPLAIRYEDAGKLIGRSPRTIRRMIDRGELTGLRGVALVEYASVEAWVKERRKR